MPGPHLAWQLDSGSPPTGGYRIGLDWITGLVLTVAGLFG
jgi:hypothetical protein